MDLSVWTCLFAEKYVGQSCLHYSYLHTDLVNGITDQFFKDKVIKKGRKLRSVGEYKKGIAERSTMGSCERKLGEGD